MKTPGKKSTSGIKYVHWHPIAQKWRAYPYLNGEQIHLGLFDDIGDAERACKMFIESHAKV